MPYTPLSQPFGSPKPHYDVIVVGSGYGGGVAASRFARAGKRVALLERGREFLPGEFPADPWHALPEMQVNTRVKHIGKRTGLYDFRVNDDMNVLVGCGLGGTSLINANVSLEPEPRVFDDARWPAALRANVASLKAHFDRAREMLRPVSYPGPDLKKLTAHEASGNALGTPCTRPPINVVFQSGVNHVGVEQPACTGCGDCVSGCNVGAKSTTAMNYLPDAVNFGAEIYTRCAVRRLERDANSWRVHFALQDSGQDAFDAPTQFVTADVVVLAAGSLGSTELLLRSKANGLAVSDRVGEHFTSNGDVLGFAYNGEGEIDGIGWGTRNDLPRVGPCITGLIDLRNRPNLDDGMVIEEGSMPGAVSALLPGVFSLAAKTSGRDVGLSDPAAMAKRELESTLTAGREGSMRHTQTYLIMAHDDSNGRMRLDNDRLTIDWPKVGDQAVFKRANDNLEKATKPLGGKFVPNPIWSKELFGHDLITVHPLGGCAMADDATQGVVNHKGQVFSGSAGGAVYDNLYVCDGAVMPRSLGVNPLLTITALAERNVALAAQDRGWTIDYTLPSKRAPGVARKPGVQFTETMRGHFRVGVTDDFTRGEREGKTNASPFEFTLTIVSDDVAQLLSDPKHSARMTGVVKAPALDAKPLTVSQGAFALLPKHPTIVGAREMHYFMPMVAQSGRTFFMVGFKRVKNDFGPDVWPDTTTLYITIHDGADANAPVLGVGTLHIEPQDFAVQMTTMRITNAKDAGERIEWLAKFGKFFAGSLLDTYGGVFAKPTVFDPNASPRARRSLNLPPPEIVAFDTTDGARLRLTRYRGGDKGPVLLAHGLGVSSLIFSLDTIDVNLAEYLVAHGYDVWLLDFRASIDLPVSRTQFSGDEIARFDYPAAVQTILARTGKQSVQAVVHCFGSTTFFMAMLAGLKGVRSAAASQIATHIEAPLVTNLKAAFQLPNLLKSLGVPALDAAANVNDNALMKLFDQATKLQLLPPAEQCTSATCRRITFMYALLYQHAQLNSATHDTLHETFGIANMTAFEHLALMVRKGQIVDQKGDDVYLPKVKALDIPITFVHGSKNSCFLPASTQKTVDWLKAANGDKYRRHVIDGYGHIDCIMGMNASRDVFPLIVEHLDATQ